MPVTPTYPGVYIEEISSGVRAIAGVSTSVAAFVDYFSQGLLNKPIQIFNFADFEREFGGLNKKSEASYAIQQFFLNGGSEAWVVRTEGGTAASVEILDQISGGATALTIEAGRIDPVTKLPLKNPGDWGNNLRVTIDYPAPASGNRFNLTVFLVNKDDGQTVVRSETFRGLSIDPTDLNFVESVINDEFKGSKLVRVKATGSQRPLQTGTLSGVLTAPLALTATNPEVTVTIGTEGQGIAKLSKKPTTLEEARSLLESAIRAALPGKKAFSQSIVSIVDNRLRILPGPTLSSSQVTFTLSPDPALLTSLGLSSGTTFSGVTSGVIGGGVYPIAAGGKLGVTIGTSGPITLTLGAITNLAAARSELESKIRAQSGDAAVNTGDTAAFANVRVIADSTVGSERLIVLPGSPGKAIAFTPVAADPTVTTLQLNAGTAQSIDAFLSQAITPIPTLGAGSIFSIAIGGLGPFLATTVTAASTLSAIAGELQAAIRGANSSSAFTGVSVFGYSSGENRIVILPGATGNAIVFAAGGVGDLTTVTELRLNASAGAQANVQSYNLGASAVAGTAQGTTIPGTDGTPPNAAELIAGINALDQVNLFNILCLPRVAVLAGDSTTAVAADAVTSAAITYSEQRRAFLIVDTPEGINTVQEVKDWLNNHGGLRSKNAALYFPRILIPDPKNDFRLRSVGASGTIAGLYARTDGDRGVWKAPAGTEATLRNVTKLEVNLTDPENGTLNPLAINALRTFPVYGTISWGARTLRGADDLADDYKYIPVRRLALYLEESLYRGLKWVVFEPNDEPLWAQIRLNVGAFLNNLFRQGAFQGKTPRDAYFVKCDKESTTQNDINLGIVNVIVGFAPLKPAEFVIIKLQQIAGQIDV